ncbi:sacsin N-terminal ATP-binding-like domain-containing protein [Cupriavidus taiwanensis]|uniref:sacsin N-terminal ATP-binding-like domain-containing protein n=1 Tax=Cupriavidus taiwanensis TaxID=164546 RepID=UPI0039C071E7
MHAIEQMSAVEAAKLLMEHGAKAGGLIAFRPQSVQAAAEAVGHLAKCLADLPGAVRDSLERGRNSAAMLSGDRLQGLSEMIQNADDAGARQVRVALLGDGLWLSHDGEPIQLEHVFGIAMPWITTKSDDAAATGRHGIGLMTLRSLSSSLQVHCAPYHVQLDETALSAVSAGLSPVSRLPSSRKFQQAVGTLRLRSWR